MTVRIVKGELSTSRVCVIDPSGRELSLPSFIWDFFSAADRCDRDRINDLSEMYPETYRQLCDKGWLSEKILLRRVPKAPHLKRLQIESLLTCNLSCSYCYSTSGPTRREALSHQEILALVDEADAMGVHQVDFTGGEYFLTRGWRDQVARARGYGMKVTVHTNGTLINAPVADFLKEQKVSYVQVSVDSHKPEIHDKSRGHKNALRRTLSGLDLLASERIPTRLSLMVHKNNIQSIADTIEYFTNRYREISLNIDRVIATRDDIDSCGVSSSEFWNVVSPYLSDARLATGHNCGTELKIDSLEPDCGAYYSYAYVTAEGEVAACPTMTSRENAAFAGESVRDGGLSVAWYEGEMMNRMRYTNCRNAVQCPAGPQCGGGCRSNAYHETGYINSPDSIACNTNKNASKVFIDFASLYSHVGQ